MERGRGRGNGREAVEKYSIYRDKSNKSFALDWNRYGQRKIDWYLADTNIYS